MAFRVDDWLVEPSANRLSRDGASVRLEPRVMELLVLLAERPGEVLAKDEILERLWPDTFVTESSLFRHVSELRRALGDDSRNPRYVETIPKRGYRLIRETGPRPLPRAQPRRGVPWLAAALATLVVVAVTLPHLPRTTTTLEASGIGRHRAAADPAFRDAYARGELFENRVDCRSFEKAVASYSAAADRDRQFVDVYPKLFDALVASAVLGCRPPQPLFSKLAALLDRARQNGLDRTREDQGRAALRLWRDQDVAGAMADFQNAELAATSHDTEDLSYAVALVVAGLPERGLEEARRCLAALPADLGENWALGSVLYLTGRYDEAIEQFLETLELYPGYRPAEQLLALSYWMADDAERALRAASTAEPSADEPLQRFDAIPGYLYGLAGNRERARRTLAEWTKRARTEWVPRTSLALLHLGLGEHDEARRWLEQARREGDPWLLLLDTDPAFRTLRGGIAAGGPRETGAPASG